MDGLDELSPKRYKQVCVELGNLTRELPSLEITVSCRSAAYNGELSFLREISLVPFDSRRVEDFVRRWFGTMDEGPTADKLMAQIQKSERLSELSNQPLLLALMCSAYRRYLNISRRHTALFDQCIESLLWQWDADRAIVRESDFSSLDLEKKKWLHSRLAVRLHQARKRYSDEQFLLDSLEEDLPRFGIASIQAGQVLSELCAHHGILVKWTEDTYGFGHLALQEYLSAKWFADEKRWRQLINRNYLSDSWWENAIALCFATLSDATDAMSSVLELDELPEIERLRTLANSLKFDPIVSPELRNSLLRRILHLYHNGSAMEHNAALDMLIGIEDQWSYPIIVKSLDSKLPTRELAKLLRW